jgi:DUF1365 family protein
MNAPQLGTSALVRSRVQHRRSRPARHELDVRTFHVLLDVDDLDRLDRDVTGFGVDRWAPMAFHGADHLAGGPADVGGVRERVAALLAGRGVELPEGRLQVLCHPRTFGHVFNPVAWWFAHHPDGTLALVLAEVTSTFGDRVVHVLDELAPAADGVLQASATKRLHVSPFLPVDGLTYRFTFRPPGVPLRTRGLVHMEVHDAEGRVLTATQHLELVPFTSGNVARLLLRHQAVSLRSLLAIHLHALVLWAKRVPFHRRPTPPVDALRVRRRPTSTGPATPRTPPPATARGTSPRSDR